MGDAPVPGEPHPNGDIEVRLQRRGAAGLGAQIALLPGLSGAFDWQGERRTMGAGTQTLRF
jgi:hypothetical protein